MSDSVNGQMSDSVGTTYLYPPIRSFMIRRSFTESSFTSHSFAAAMYADLTPLTAVFSSRWPLPPP
jgi:hypothetical protein